MNLRDKISFNASQKDLEVLLVEPFEIDLDDMPIIYVVGANYTKEKLDLVKKAGLTEIKKKILSCNIGYDYSSEKRIVLAYLYSHLKEAGISDEILKDIRTIYDGIMFNHGQLGWNKSALRFNPELVPLIYPEYAEKIEQFESKYKPALERVKRSEEYDKLVSILNKYIGYDRELGKGKIWGVQDEFDSLRGEENKKYLIQIAEALKVDDEKAKRVELRGCHNTGCAYEQVSNLLQKEK